MPPPRTTAKKFWPVLLDAIDTQFKLGAEVSTQVDDERDLWFSTLSSRTRRFSPAPIGRDGESEIASETAVPEYSRLK
jgi:hypothetical protein